jgi:hypothetical protein
MMPGECRKKYELSPPPGRASIYFLLEALDTV